MLKKSIAANLAKYSDYTNDQSIKTFTKAYKLEKDITRVELGFIGFNSKNATKYY